MLYEMIKMLSKKIGPRQMEEIVLQNIQTDPLHFDDVVELRDSDDLSTQTRREPIIESEIVGQVIDDDQHTPDFVIDERPTIDILLENLPSIRLQVDEIDEELTSLPEVQGKQIFLQVNLFDKKLCLFL